MLLGIDPDSHFGMLKISRLQCFVICDDFPGALPQAITFRAVGANTSQT